MCKHNTAFFRTVRPAALILCILATGVNAGPPAADDAHMAGGTEEERERNATLLSGYDYSKYPAAITGFSGQDLQRVGLLRYAGAVRTRVGPRGNYKAGLTRLPDGKLLVAVCRPPKFPIIVYQSRDDGRILATYSNYHLPFGVYAVVSQDQGKTWDLDHPSQLALSASNYVGWPVTLQLSDGSLLTSYAVTAYLHQPPAIYVCEVVRWRLP